MSVLSLDPGSAYTALYVNAVNQACLQRWLAVFSSVLSTVTKLGSAITARSVTRNRKHKSQGSRKFRWVIIIVGIGASLAFLAQIIAGAKLGIWWRIGITGSGMLCTGLAVVLPLIEQRATEQTLLDVEEATKAGRLGAHTRLQDSLIPVCTVINAIASQPSAEQKSNLKRAIVDLVAREIGPMRTRSCYFDYDPGPPRSLECRAYSAGRSTSPACYTDETKIGKIALTMVSKRKFNFRPDLDKDAPDGWPSDKEYKTYIAVTVAAGSRIFGMLTVDSLKAGDLVATDLPQVEMLAIILAVGLAIGEGDV